MFNKTEIFMMREKIIPALLNSEKKIKFEDIKEIFEKTSYWKNINYKYGKSFSTNIKLKKASIKDRPKLLNIKTKYINNPNFNDLININNHKNKSRNEKQNNLFNTENNESFKYFNPSKTSIHFCNPILKYYSQKINILKENSNNKKNKNFILKTEVNRNIKESKSFKNNILLKEKLSLKNNRIFLKKFNTDYEYKYFYYFKKNRINKYKSRNKIQIDEINNRLILRGLSMNDGIKNCYSKCQLINLEINENKNNLKKIPKITNNKKKKINKNIKHFIRNGNKDINIIYSLNGLLDYKYPINIRGNST